MFLRFPLFTPDRKWPLIRLIAPGHIRLREGTIQVVEARESAFDPAAFLASSGLGPTPHWDFWRSVSGNRSRKNQALASSCSSNGPSLRRLRLRPRPPGLLRRRHICPAPWAHLARNVQETGGKTRCVIYRESNGFGTTRAPFNQAGKRSTFAWEM
jgi:hypothetical protein